MAIDLLDYYTCPSSCWLLWLPCWKNVLHEDVSGKVQTAGELAAGGGSQTENRAASTIVSDTHTNVPQVYFITHLYSKFICINPSAPPWFLSYSAVRPTLLSRRWATQTPCHLNQSSSHQRAPAWGATIWSHPHKWADQTTSMLQASSILSRPLSRERR